MKIKEDYVKKQEYSSCEFYLTAYLICAGLKLIRTERQSDKKVNFILNDSPKRPILVEQYFSNRAKVNPLEFKTKIGDLKALIYNS
jgi:hypothetical protein